MASISQAKSKLQKLGFCGDDTMLWMRTQLQSRGCLGQGHQPSTASWSL